jgi:Bacterial HORMA domain 2
MSVSVSVRSYTHSVTYVTDNILKSLKDIIRLSGLDPANLAGAWGTIERGVRTWITSGHLERIVLEVYDPRTNALVNRWDVEISYEWTGGDGEFWTDTEAIRFAIKKAGVAPGTARYDLKATLKSGSPDVVGWSATTLRGTAGMVEQRIGTTLEGSGLSGGFSYYRRA